MGTIADKLNYLNTTKGNIKNAIINKGVSVSDSDTFRSYADKIASIGADAYTIVDDTTPASLKTLATAPYPMAACKVRIEAVQDLNGYSKPWAGGAGKNKLPLDLDAIKSFNLVGTWSGNTYTYLGVTATFDVDDNGYVNSITLNGTAENIYELRFPDLTLADNSYILNGVTGGSASTYRVNLYETSLIVQSLDGDSPSFTADSTLTYRLYAYITSGVTVTNVTIRPMIRLSTVADATFEPYSNICPISGKDVVNLSVCGKNRLNPSNKIYNNYYCVFGGTLGSDIPNGSLKLPAGTYTLSVPITCNSINVRKSDSSLVNSVVNTNSLTFTLSSTENIKVAFGVTTDWSTVSDIQLEVGSTATTYEAYNGQTYTENLATTNFGGYWDAVAGEVGTNRVCYTITGAETTWRALGNGFGFQLPINASGYATSATSSHYKRSSYVSWGSIGEGEFGIADNYIGIVDSANFTTIAEAQSYFANLETPCQVCYPLATSTTSQTTPRVINTNSGVTNIWADSGKIERAKYLTPLS